VPDARKGTALTAGAHLSVGAGEESAERAGPEGKKENGPAGSFLGRGNEKKRRREKEGWAWWAENELGGRKGFAFSEIDSNTFNSNSNSENSNSNWTTNNKTMQGQHECITNKQPQFRK